MHFDVLITRRPLVDGLIKNGKILADSRVNLLHSGMGVEVSSGDSSPLECFDAPNVARGENVRY